MLRLEFIPFSDDTGFTRFQVARDKIIMLPVE